MQPLRIPVTATADSSGTVFIQPEFRAAFWSLLTMSVIALGTSASGGGVEWFYGIGAASKTNPFPAVQLMARGVSAMLGPIPIAPGEQVTVYGNGITAGQQVSALFWGVQAETADDIAAIMGTAAMVESLDGRDSVSIDRQGVPMFVAPFVPTPSQIPAFGGGQSLNAGLISGTLTNTQTAVVLAGIAGKQIYIYDWYYNAVPNAATAGGYNVYLRTDVTNEYVSAAGGYVQGTTILPGYAMRNSQLPIILPSGEGLQLLGSCVGQVGTIGHFTYVQQ